MNSLSPVPFHGQTLFVIPVNDQPFTPIKPIVEGMGMNWAAQFTKLKTNYQRWGIAMIATPSDGGQQETLCMPLRKLPGWLMTINPKKVAIGIRKTVILYQNECDDALWDFWTKGQAVNKRKPLQMSLRSSDYTIKDYASVYKNLPESQQYWGQILARFGNQLEEFKQQLSWAKKDALRPFRQNRSHESINNFDETMEPIHSLFDVANEELRTIYKCVYEAMGGCMNAWRLLRRG